MIFLVNSDERLTLEMSVFESFTVANVQYLLDLVVDNLLLCYQTQLRSSSRHTMLALLSECKYS